MSRNFLIGLSILMVFTLITASAQAAEKVRFASHFKANPHYTLPAIAALEKGYWKEAGLEAEWFPFDSPAIMWRAVAAGKIDMGTAGLTSLIHSLAAGLPVAYVARPGITTRFYIWVPTDSPIREPRDLKGARVGVTALGTAPHFYGAAVAKALRMEKEIKLVGAGGGVPAIAALKARAVDGLLLSNLTMAPVKAEGEVRELLAIEDYLPGGLTEDILYAHREFVEKKPEVVRKVVKGYLKAAELVTRDRDWAIKTMKKDFGFSEKVAVVVYPMMRYEFGKIDEKMIEDNIRFQVEYGLLTKEKAPAVEKIYAKGFAD